MRKTARSIIVAATVLAAACLAGCGKKDEDSGKKGSDEFRIPDSLIAPIEKFDIVRDEYHPIRGGVLADERIELHYPASEIARFIAVKTFEHASEGYEAVTREIGRPAEGKIVLVGTKDLEEYRFLTRKEWWYYGVNEGDTIIFEPLDIMIKRTIAPVAITQKMAQAALARRSGGRIPLWLREAIASDVSGERYILEMQVEEFRHEGTELNLPPDRIDEALAESSDRKATRIAFWGAHLMFEKLLERYSRDDVMRFVDRLGGGASLDDASVEAFGISYGTLVDSIRIDGRQIEGEEGTRQRS